MGRRRARAAALLEAPVPSDPRRTIPRELDAIVLKALRKEPEARYSSAAALAEDLERDLRGDLVQARADEGYYVLTTLIRRHRRTALVAGALLVMLVAALVGVSLAWQYAEHARRVARAGLEMAGHVRLGGVAHNEGRTEQAILLFENAARLGEQLGTDDPMVQFLLQDARQRLSHLYRKMGRVEDADRCVAALVAQAERMVRDAPDDEEWMRLLAFARLRRAAWRDRTSPGTRPWCTSTKPWECFNDWRSARRGRPVRRVSWVRRCSKRGDCLMSADQLPAAGRLRGGPSPVCRDRRA